MIPVRLVLHDFLSYVSPDPIDFTAFDVACLTGENGVGKSALLDAMTWAIWGSARGCEGGQNQDRLIRDGADATAVDFTFALDDATYRVLRRRSRAGKGELRFLVADGDDWTNLAGETVRETEARISSLLRMDFRTFTASAFFVQGRAEDVLARMRPDERKDVFARLLDLGAYDLLEDAARARARAADVRRAEHARRTEELSGAADDVAALEGELQDARAHAGKAEKEAKRATDDVGRRRTEVGELEKLELLLGTESKRLAEAELTLRDACDAVESKKAELARLAELLSRGDEVRSALAETERLRAEEETARRQQERAAELQSRRAALEERIEAQRQSVELRLRGHRQRIADVEAEAASLRSVQAELGRLEEALAGVGDPHEAVEETRQLLEQHRSQEGRLTEQLAALEGSTEEVTERLALLARGGGECPVCGSPLDDEHRRRVKRSLAAEARELARRRGDAQAALDTARKEAARCAEELTRLGQAVRERETLLAARDGAVARAERLPVLLGQLEHLRSLESEDGQILVSGAFAIDLRAELETVEAELAHVYDPQAHDELRERLASLEHYRTLGGRIEEATQRRRAAQRELEELNDRTAQASVSLGELRSAVEALEAQVEGLPTARAELLASEEALEERSRQASVASSEVARLVERLEAARRTAGELLAAVEAERTAVVEHRRYRRLAEAFGRGGIPDLIIDNALPALEQDANDILGRLTDYEMTVHFAMQRGTKSGRSKETFDVLVHHDGGLRDFAMFSGGEAFRIAFAVRLAMSKLLVTRAGASLRMLVIDEGFGTQDPAGRERLVDAINLARQEFGKVLVITHLEDLKDLFGTQIRVSKDPARGSTVTLVRS